MNKANIGLVGLAVMGENLVMNMESKGFTVAVYNRSTDKVKNFVEGRAAGKNIIGCYSIEELVANLAKPRKIMMMVKAGAAVDALIDQLLPLLEEGDILIDGGNSHFPDTIRRTAYVEEKGMLYVGSGVSGGDEGRRGVFKLKAAQTAMGNHADIGVQTKGSVHGKNLPQHHILDSSIGIARKVVKTEFAAYRKLLMKISRPMAIRITPPRTEAFPASLVPNLRPMNRPAMQITKVTTAMMSAQTTAIRAL